MACVNVIVLNTCEDKMGERSAVQRSCLKQCDADNDDLGFKACAFDCLAAQSDQIDCGRFECESRGDTNCGENICNAAGDGHTCWWQKTLLLAEEGHHVMEPSVRDDSLIACGIMVGVVVVFAAFKVRLILTLPYLPLS